MTGEPSGVALLRAYPVAEGALPRSPIGHWPTRLTELPELAAELGLGALQVKCDGRAAAPFGGNKVRKLEWILGDALARGFQRVWTVCTVGSHHGLSTALYGRRLGLEVELLQFPQPVTDYVLDLIRAIAGTGARMTLVASKARLPLAVTARRLRAGLGGERSLYVPGGGSSAVGTLGYVSAAFELAEQLRERGWPPPDRIYVACSTGATFAGLWLGCRLAGLDTPVVGVRVVDRILANQGQLRRLALGALGLLHAADAARELPLRALITAPLHLVHGQVGRGYGEATPAGRGARALLQAHSGPRLDDIYTAKAFAQLVADARAGRTAGQRVLFWNTFNQQPMDSLVAATRVEDLPREYGRFFAR